jgi:hypothetical protein
MDVRLTSSTMQLFVTKQYFEHQKALKDKQKK